ncbi:Ganglioside-induced differentiation-associated protein 2 [Linum perenne]
MTVSLTLSFSDQIDLLVKLQVFKLQGRDKRGNVVLRVVGKYFPARLVSYEAVKQHLEESVIAKLGEKPFSVVYFHAGVQRSENFPGVSALRMLYDAVPEAVKNNLQAVYFIHPGIQARLFFATVGRFIFTGGLYEKVKYVSRLEFAWDNVRKGEMEVPEFVVEHEEELEYRPVTTLDYGMESDFPRPYNAGANMDNPMALYSMRCIS